MRRRQGSLVSGIHRLKHVEGLAAAHLPNDDPIWTHAKRVPDELANGDLAPTLHVRRPRLERDHMRFRKPKLGRVLDRDEPLAVGNEDRQHAEQRRLAGSRTPRTTTFARPRTHAERNRSIRGPIDPCVTRSVGAGGTGENLRIVKEGPRSERGGMIAWTDNPLPSLNGSSAGRLAGGVWSHP